MLYTDQTIESVRLANDIVDIVGLRVKLTRKGKYFFGLCPFHNEKTPSFSVDPDRQMYYCYSCNKGGDVYRFLAETERLTFPEAVQRLAERANIELPESDDPGAGRAHALARERRDRLRGMNALAATFFANCLRGRSGGGARAYLQRRMLREDTLKKFGIGYAPPEWDALYRHLSAQGYSDEEQLSGGLALKNKNGGYYDRFRNRVMFPILDVSGYVCAFGGRVLDDSVPKYMNSPETDAYSKGRTLYGLHLSKATREKYMLVVEGYMDLITLAASGIDNAVAPLGTALTESQASLLKRYTEEVVIAFDTDTAGRAAALRGLDILDRQGFRVRVMTLPQGKDPDDFVRANGPDAFRGLVSEAETLVDYKISSLRRQYPGGDVESNARFLKEAVKVLADIGDAMERELYVARLASQHQIPERAVREEVDKLAGGGERGGAYAGGGHRYGAGRDTRAATRPRQDTERRLTGPARDTPAARISGAAPGAQAANRAVAAAPGVPVAPVGVEGTAGANAAGLSAATNLLGATVGLPTVSAARPAFGRSDVDEFFVVALLSDDASLWDTVAEGLPSECVANEHARACIAYLCEKASRREEVRAAELLRFFTPDEADLFAKTLTKSCLCEDSRRAMEQKIRDIRSGWERRRMYEILRALETGNLSEEENAGLRRQLSAVSRRSPAVQK